MITGEHHPASPAATLVVGDRIRIDTRLGGQAFAPADDGYRDFTPHIRSGVVVAVRADRIAWQPADCDYITAVSRIESVMIRRGREWVYLVDSTDTAGA